MLVSFDESTLYQMSLTLWGGKKRPICDNKCISISCHILVWYLIKAACGFLLLLLLYNWEKCLYVTIARYTVERVHSVLVAQQHKSSVELLSNVLELLTTCSIFFSVLETEGIIFFFYSYSMFASTRTSVRAENKTGPDASLYFRNTLIKSIFKRVTVCTWLLFWSQ